MTAQQRDHGLDAARGILMMLGILLHTANIYRPGSTWLLADADANADIFTLLARAIHVFRMPAFFWISGYFTAMTLLRKGPAALLLTRATRLLVPLIVVASTLNVAQDLLLASYKGQSLAWADLRLHAHHLWFLIDLVAFTLLLCALAPALRALQRRAGDAPRHGGIRMLAIVLAACALFGYALELCVRLSGLAYKPVLGLFTLFELANYFPYFLVGAYMHGRRDLLQQLASTSPLGLPLGIAIAMLAAHWTRSAPNSLAEPAHLLQLVGIWLSVASALGGFYRFFDHSTAFTRLVSDSAYSVYLLHHFLVIAFGMLLMSLPWWAWAKFLVVCAATTAAGLAAHLLLIRRSRVLSFLLNGKPPAA
jgi:glucan biosynthesis protein C